ncbi:hypothetical protein D3C78_1009610 [compost metagenome]
MLRPFEHVHQGAEHRYQGRDTEQKHDDLLLAAAQCREQVMRLFEIGAELEHAEDAQHPDYPNDQQVLCVAVVQGDDARHDRQQVDQTVEAESVA